MNLLIQNKRKSRRVPTQISASIKHEETLVNGTTTVDVSDGGVLLNTPVYLAKNLSIKCALHLRDNSSYEAIEGRILRAVPILRGNRYAIAIQFDSEQVGLTDAVKAEKASA